MFKYISTLSETLDSSLSTFDEVFETIKKNVKVNDKGEKEISYTTNKPGHKVMFDEDGNPVETKMDFKEKSNRKKGGVKSGLQQKKTKKVVMTHLKSMSEKEEDEDEDDEKDSDEPENDKDTKKDSDEPENDKDNEPEDDSDAEEEPEDDAEEEPDEEDEPTGEDGDDENFDDGDEDEEQPKPKSEMLYKDLEIAIDELDAFKLKTAFRMYEKMLKYVYDESSIRLMNFVYELIPPSRRKKVSADMFVKQIEDQIKEKKA